jgi:hypothetical protein
VFVTACKKLADTIVAHIGKTFRDDQVKAVDQLLYHYPTVNALHDSTRPLDTLTVDEVDDLFNHLNLPKFGECVRTMRIDGQKLSQCHELRDLERLELPLNDLGIDRQKNLLNMIVGIWVPHGVPGNLLKHSSSNTEAKEEGKHSNEEAKGESQHIEGIHRSDSHHLPVGKSRRKFVMHKCVTRTPMDIMASVFEADCLHCDPDNLSATADAVVKSLHALRARSEEKKAYDCFLAYRSDTDERLAERLYEELVQRDIRPFMDKKCLQPGEALMDGRIRGKGRGR